MSVGRGVGGGFLDNPSGAVIRLGKGHMVKFHMASYINFAFNFSCARPNEQ